MDRLLFHWVFLSVFLTISLAEIVVRPEDDLEDNHILMNIDGSTISEYMEGEDLKFLDENDVEEESPEIEVQNRHASIKTEVESNIAELLEQGFEAARKLVFSRRRADRMRKKFSDRSVMKKSFHKRVASKETVHFSECKALGLLETSKIIAKKYETSGIDVGDLLKSIEIPAKLCKKINDNCGNSISRKTRMTVPNCNKLGRSQFRTINGICNNMANGLYGSSDIQFIRHLKPQYANKVSDPRNGKDMPNPRDVSVAIGVNTIEKQRAPRAITQMLKAWGQFLDHDIVLAPAAEAPDCCHQGLNGDKHDDCLPIDVRHDPFFSQNNVDCLEFQRSIPFCKEDCGLAPREQMNGVTCFIDGSNVYGSHEKKAKSLRTMKGGKLKINDVGELGSCKASPCKYPFLPETAKTDMDEDAPFLAGDVRVNEQPSLTALHTIFMRFHNLFVEKLAPLRKDFNDERLYQEGRKMVGDLLQHISYTEFLPILMGEKYYKKSGLMTLKQYTAYSKYDRTINPSISNVFGIAYRFGHSLITDTMIDDLTLTGNYFNSVILYKKATNPSAILDGECSIPSEQMDISLTKAVVNRLFTKEGDNVVYGTDLMSLNILRGRDHGLPGYNDWRKYCKLSTFNNFDELKTRNVMPKEVVDALKKVYKGQIRNLDLFPGLLAENRLPGAYIGPLLFCLLKEQFLALKHGDRFWYENIEKSATSKLRMVLLKRATLSSVLCETTTLHKLQKYVMMNSDIKGNAKTVCSKIRRDYSILSDWKMRIIALTMRR